MLPPPPAHKRRPAPRSQKEVLDDIAVAESAILLTDQELDKLPAEIRFDQAHGGEKLLRLNHEKKRFVDCIKVFACNLQAQMCRLLLKHYDWRKEVVPALAMIVERTGYLKLERGRLGVTLRRFMDREIDYAARVSKNGTSMSVSPGAGTEIRKPKPEIRRPKAEIRKKSEIRNPKSQGRDRKALGRWLCTQY